MVLTSQSSDMGPQTSAPETVITALLDAALCIGSKVPVFRRDALLPSSDKKEKPGWENVNDSVKELEMCANQWGPKALA